MVQVGLLMSDIPKTVSPNSSSATSCGSSRRRRNGLHLHRDSASTSSTATCAACSRCRCWPGWPPTWTRTSGWSPAPDHAALPPGDAGRGDRDARRRHRGPAGLRGRHRLPARGVPDFEHPVQGARAAHRRVPRGDDPALDRGGGHPPRPVLERSTTCTRTSSRCSNRIRRSGSARTASPVRAGPAGIGDAFTVPPETTVEQVASGSRSSAKGSPRGASRSGRSRCAATSLSPTPTRRPSTDMPGCRKRGTSPISTAAWM